MVRKTLQLHGLVERIHEIRATPGTSTRSRFQELFVVLSPLVVHDVVNQRVDFFMLHRRQVNSGAHRRPPGSSAANRRKGVKSDPLLGRKREKFGDIHTGPREDDSLSWRHVAEYRATDRMPAGCLPRALSTDPHYYSMISIADKHHGNKTKNSRS